MHMSYRQQWQWPDFRQVNAYLASADAYGVDLKTAACRKHYQFKYILSFY